jgi:hypothetical protein
LKGECSLWILGLDIGGANIKVGLVEISNGRIMESRTMVRYLPLWRDGKKKLSSELQEISTFLSQTDKIDQLGLTMTAELSDVFKSKKEGVEYVLKNVENIWSNTKPLIVDNTGRLIAMKECYSNYLTVSSANWAATAKVLTNIFKECILIDVGSTTTDIVPIVDHKVSVSGRTDLERLATGELIYTGILRSTIPSIVHSIPVKGNETKIASEIFALSADVHLILGNISQGEYSTETADGRGKSYKECLSRLARMVCADSDFLGETELKKIANSIYSEQVKQIEYGLKQVWNRDIFEKKSMPNLAIVTTGLGGRILGKEAASNLGFRNFNDMGEILGIKNSQAITAISVAILLAESKGEKLVWPQS